MSANAPACAQCGHAAHLHVPGIGQCGHRLDGEHRCCCDEYQSAT